jgi:hypothetical protein
MLTTAKKKQAKMDPTKMSSEEEKSSQQKQIKMCGMTS